jgi:hypothetical protein
MKLVEFVSKLEKKKEQLGNLEEKITGGNGLVISGLALKGFEKSLFECDEFKEVVRINFLEVPTYLIDQESGEPIAASREFLGGQLKTQETVSFQVMPNQELKFGKYVDLYSITLNKRYNAEEDIKKPGVWIYPTTYDEKTFAPTSQIRVIWDPEQLKDALAIMGRPETPKERIMRMFETALDNMDPNIACEYVMTIRCSSRSVVVAEENKESGVTGFYSLENKEPTCIGLTGLHSFSGNSVIGLTNLGD